MEIKVLTLLILIFSVIIFSGFSGCFNPIVTPIEQPLNQKAGMEKDIAISTCKTLYSQKKALEEDMSNGPCLSDKIVDDWACDVAHNPRQDIDNEPKNQCVSYRNGETHHFVELDINGELIKAE